MKAICMFALIGAGTVFIANPPLSASETDDRIESSFSKSYAYQSYLKDDAIKAESRNGVVILTGRSTKPATSIWPRKPWPAFQASTGWTIACKSNWRALRNQIPGSERKCAAYWRCIAT